MFEKRKKAQLTIFIIIAVLVVASVIMFFIFRNNAGSGKSIPEEVDPIYVYVVSCLEETVDKGIKELYEKGGYYEIPGNLLLEYYTEDYSFYYLDKTFYIPSKNVFENELENYVLGNINSCLDFSVFEKQGFEIQEREMDVSCSVYEGNLEVVVEYPLVISREDFSAETSEFNVQTSSNVEELLELSEVIVEDYYLSSGNVCISCFEEYYYDFGFRVTSKTLPANLVSPENNVVLFSVQDSENELNWRFVVEA